MPLPEEINLPDTAKTLGISGELSQYQIPLVSEILLQVRWWV